MISFLRKVHLTKYFAFKLTRFNAQINYSQLQQYLLPSASLFCVGQILLFHFSEINELPNVLKDSFIAIIKNSWNVYNKECPFQVVHEEQLPKNYVHEVKRTCDMSDLRPENISIDHK